MTSFAAAWSKVTVKVADPADSVTVELATVKTGVSSSVITKSAVVVSPSMVALVADDRVKVAVSSTSSVESKITGTSISPEVAPAVMVSVPVTAV